MWGLLKKAGEMIAPIIATDTLAEFKNACSQALDAIKTHTDENLIAFQSSLTNIQDYLQEELSKDDMRCFGYLAQMNILQQIADSLTNNLPSNYIEPVFHFFIGFVNTDLSHYFVQVTVHGPLCSVVSKMESLYQKSPTQISKFAFELWDATVRSPMVLDFLCINDGNQISYPLLDFLCSASMMMGEIGSTAQEAILTLISHSELPNAAKTGKKPEFKEFPPQYSEYVFSHLNNEIAQYIAAYCGCVDTMQFNGSAAKFLNWIDNLMLKNFSNFPFSIIFEAIEKLSPPRQMIACAFLLSFFVNEGMVSNTLKFCTTAGFISEIVDSLRSTESEAQHCAVVLVKILLLTRGRNLIIPQVSQIPSDVLNILPPSWLLIIDGSTALDSYESDALNKIMMFNDDQNNIQTQDSTEIHAAIFDGVIELFKQFKNLRMSLCLSIIHLISLFIAAQPGLISGELITAYKFVVEQYSDVETFVIPTGESTKDSPEVRAAILAEFGKMMHATFVAHEKLAAFSQEIFEVNE